jgi:hypothetical protein
MTKTNFDRITFSLPRWLNEYIKSKTRQDARESGRCRLPNQSLTLCNLLVDARELPKNVIKKKGR